MCLQYVTRWMPCVAGFRHIYCSLICYKKKKEAKMSGIATILGWVGFITLKYDDYQYIEKVASVKDYGRV